MQKIRFNNSQEEYDVFIKISGKHITCTFDTNDDLSKAPISEGFVELNEHNNYIQSDFSEFKYIYKLEDDGVTVILTKIKDDIYIEPTIEEMVTQKPTELESLDLEKQNGIDKINTQINALKNELSSKDYMIIKGAEAILANEDLPDYDFVELRNHRQEIRTKINSLEDELDKLLAVDNI